MVEEIISNFVYKTYAQTPLLCPFPALNTNVTFVKLLKELKMKANRKHTINCHVVGSEGWSGGKDVLCDLSLVKMYMY